MIAMLAFVPPGEDVNSWDELLHILYNLGFSSSHRMSNAELMICFMYREINHIGQNMAGVRHEPTSLQLKFETSGCGHWNIVA